MPVTLLRPLTLLITFSALVAATPPATADDHSKTLAVVGDFESKGYWAKSQTVDVDGQSFDTAIQVKTRQQPGKPWGVLLQGRYQADVPADHSVVVVFKARALVKPGTATLKSGCGGITQRFTIGTEWQPYRYSFRTKKPVQAGKTKIEFFLGHQAQTIEIGGLRVLGFGTHEPPAVLPEGATVPEPSPAAAVPFDAAANPYRAMVLDELPEILPEPVFMLADREDQVPARSKHTSQSVTRRVVPSEGRGFTQALELRVVRKPAKRWQAQLTVSTARPIRKNDAMLLVFDVRATASSHASGHGQLIAMLGQSGKPYKKSFSHKVDAGHGWQRVYVRGLAAADYAPGEARVEMWLGDLKQTLEIGGLTLMNFGPIDLQQLPKPDLDLDYAGRSLDAAWRIAAEQRIRQHRMADLTVRVRDAAGQPVSGATVKIEQQQHAFMFGTTSDTRIMTGYGDIDAQTASDHQAFLTSGMFNLLVPGNEYKWPAWVGSFGAYYKPERTDWLLEWAEARDMPVKGHVLVWNLPGKVRRAVGDDPEKVRRAVKDRIAEAAGRHAGRLVSWDVINENYKHNSIVNIVGHDEVANWFRWAKDASGGARLFWNEIHVLPDTDRGREVRAYTLERLRNLQRLGAPIDGLGIQGHLSIGASPGPETILQHLNTFAELGLEIQITEFDVNIRDRNDPDQVAFQADYTRDFLTTVFSHPAVTGVIYWTPYPYRWLPQTALVNPDHSLRPHGKVWKDLVMRAWWTSSSGTSDAAGRVSERVFKGKHLITVEHNGQRSTKTIEVGDVMNATVELE